MMQGRALIMGQLTQEPKAELCLGRAIAAELRRIYPTHTTKMVARDLACTVKAAENLLDGHFSSTSMGKIILAYGAGWVAERVLEAAGTNLEQYIEKQAVDLEREAARVRERAREARERLAKYKAARRSAAVLDGRDADPRQ